MKRLFSINQGAIIENGLSIDIVEAAIFDLLKDFAHSELCKRFTENGRTYFLFSWRIINTQAPMLGLKSRQSVYNRIESLIINKLLERHPDNQITNQSWYCFGENYSKVVYHETVKH